MVDRKRDKNFKGLTVYLPKELEKQFKIACIQQEISNQSAGAEAAISFWLNGTIFLQALLERRRPKNCEIVRLAHDLDVEAEKLVELCDRLLPKTQETQNQPEEKTNGKQH